MTRGIGSYLRVRWPSITEKERRFSITVVFDRLDEFLALLLRPFAMMHRLHKPTARQHIDKRPSIPQVLSIQVVFAQVRFFLIYISLPYTFFLLNGDMELNKNRQVFVNKMF